MFQSIFHWYVCLKMAEYSPRDVVHSAHAPMLPSFHFFSFFLFGFWRRIHMPCAPARKISFFFLMSDIIMIDFNYL